MEQTKGYLKSRGFIQDLESPAAVREKEHGRLYYYRVINGTHLSIKVDRTTTLGDIQSAISHAQFCKSKAVLTDRTQMANLRSHFGR